MPPNFAVRAKVVDIRRDTPKSTDVFLVDTMVWHWLTYSKATPHPYQIRSYPPYVKQARNRGAALLYCGISLSELAHQIEQNELEIFNKASTFGVKTKEFRHNYPAQRLQVATEVTTAWGIVKAFAGTLDLVVDEATTDGALARFQTHLLDGYDLLHVEAMAKGGVSQMLTDDGDYCTVPGITVFTANGNVIAAAASQKMLVTR
jgi:hypothetical protein